MKKLFKLSTLLFTMAFLLVGTKAEAFTLEDILERMDEIIAEMQSLRVEFDDLQSQVSTSNDDSTVTSSAFTLPLEYGETNSDIKRVQQLLKTDPVIYSYGVTSGFFGPKTQEAIRNLQTRFDLEPVGVVGPATTALLNAFFQKYPEEVFPANALTSDPRTSVNSATNNGGVANQIQAVQDQIATLQSAQDTGSVDEITAVLDRGEAEVEIEYKNGKSTEFIVIADDEAEVVEAIRNRTSLSTAVIKATFKLEDDEDDEDDDDDEEDDEDDEDYDEDDAEEAIDDAEKAIDDTDDEIEEADEDGDDVDWAEETLEEAEEKLDDAEDAFDDEDWDEAVELADEAKDLAKEAEDRIDEEENSSKGDSDEIEEIEVEVDNNESEVTVKYEDDEDYEFTVEEDKRDEIIEEVADELDIDEDEVEDLIEFDFGDIDDIEVAVDYDEGEATVDVEYESGASERFVIDVDDGEDEDDMIETIAEYLNIDEDDVEEAVDFDYQ